MALLQRAYSSAIHRSNRTAIFGRTSFKCSGRAHRARSQCTTRTFAAAPTSNASMPSPLRMDSNSTYSSWSASALTSTQTSVALLFSALVLTVAAEGGITGLLMLTALVMGYMYPAKVMSFTSIGYQVLQATATTLSAALGIKTHVQCGSTFAGKLKVSETSPAQFATGKAASELPTSHGLASTASKPTDPEFSAPSADVKALLTPTSYKPERANTQLVTASKNKSNTTKDPIAFENNSGNDKALTAFENKTHVFKTLTASENSTGVATDLTAFADKMTPNVIPTAAKGSNLQTELTKASPTVGTTGSTSDLKGYVAEQLAKPASFRSMSINALCVELPPRDLPGRVRPEDFKHRGAITVSTNDPETFARKLAVQRQWEEQAEGGGLPRLSISSLSGVFACDWTALKLYVATPLDWGVNGPKAVTWGDMRVVAAFGIAAGAAQAAEAEGKGAASTAGRLAEAEAVCEGEGQVVVLGHVAAAGITEGYRGRKVSSTHSLAGSAAVEAAAARLAVPAAVSKSAGSATSLKKGVKKGFGGKLLGVAKAVPLVAVVLATKATMMIGGF